jgi:ribonuclease Y
MGTIIALIIGGVVGICGTFALVKYGLKWVNIKDIPEEEIESAAKKMMSKKFEDAEEEIAELREREEKRLKEIRKENAEHEEILVERERSLNKRSKVLDDKSEELARKEKELKALSEKIEETRASLKTELEKLSGLSREEATE